MPALAKKLVSRCSSLFLAKVLDRDSRGQMPDAAGLNARKIRAHDSMV
jgi:hypothetical protein